MSKKNLYCKISQNTCHLLKKYCETSFRGIREIILAGLTGLNLTIIGVKEK